MDRATADALHRVNRDFYRRRAAEFSASRARPWPGWRRVLAAYLEGHRAAAPARILDLGCGNGRLGAFLAPRLGSDHRYLGLDASPAMLALARRFPGRFPGARFAAADLVADPWPLAPAGRFAWISAFGLLHHIAGGDNRRRLMRRLGRLLAPGGLASVSFWQFAGRSRFDRRRLPWNGLDRGELEEGDHLLRWGDGGDRRYCHHVADAEAEALASASGLRLADRFRADGEGGDLNLYLLLARPAPSSDGGSSR